MRRWHITIVALALFSGLLIYTLFYDKPGDTEKKGEAPAIFSLDTSEIRKISLAGPNGFVTLEREESGQDGLGWRVTEPGTNPADNAKADELASALAGLKALRVVEAGAESLSSFGLDRPAATAELTMADGSQKTILLGDKTPLEDGQQSYYAMEKGGADVYTIPGRVANLLLRDNLSDWSGNQNF